MVWRSWWLLPAQWYWQTDFRFPIRGNQSSLGFQKGDELESRLSKILITYFLGFEVCISFSSLIWLFDSVFEFRVKCAHLSGLSHVLSLLCSCSFQSIPEDGASFNSLICFLWCRYPTFIFHLRETVFSILYICKCKEWFNGEARLDSLVSTSILPFGSQWGFIKSKMY